MEQTELIISLLVVVGCVGALAQKVKIALPILLVVTGMIISVIPQIPDIILEPNVVFLMLMPPLIYVDAFNTPWKQLTDVADAISLQAFGLVLVTVAAVGAAIHAVVPDMPWAAAFIFGAIVSPTDAVAASAISREINLPKRILNVIKGESLINDATGLVAYQFAVAAMVTGTFSWSEAGLKFIYVSVIGIAIGYLVGWLLLKVRTILDNPPVEMIASLISPFLAYLVAEHFHASGVLSVVTAGLLLGWHAPKMHRSHTRLHLQANWEAIDYILNGFAFLLLGLQLQPVLRTLCVYPLKDLIIWTITAAVSPILVRFAWTFAVAPIVSLRRHKKPSWKGLFILSWAGMRGVVSLAAALAIPMTCSAGHPFPYRDLILFLTMVVIISTLLLQGMTLPFIVNKFGFDTDDAEAIAAERQARLFLSREAVRAIDSMARAKNIDMEHPNLMRLMNHHLDKSVQHISEQRPNLDEQVVWRELHLETISCQRKVLIALREKHEIKEDLFRLLQAELDFEEAQFHIR